MNQIGKLLSFLIMCTQTVLRLTLPTCISLRSKALIRNIFFKEVNETVITRKLITDISGHHSEFLITPKILENE